MNMKKHDKNTILLQMKNIIVIKDIIAII